MTLRGKRLRAGRVCARKMTFRGHGAMVGGTSNDMPPPPGPRLDPSKGRAAL